MSKSPKKPKEKGPDIAGLLLTGRFFSQLCEAPTGTPAADESERSRLVYFSECGTSAQKSWILKGLIARGETSAWIGPPKAAKSAFVTDMSVHAAACLAWQGHKAKEACGVLILALERADLTRRRLHAYAMREGHKDLPIAVHGGIIDMMNPACVDLIVQLVREAEAHLARPVGIIIIDTFNKGIAVGGGDEDKARDQNRAAANLRRLHELLPVHIALVGHTGKDESRGARGSNAHLGDVDVMAQISGDQPERLLAQFRLEVFTTGADEDGDPMTTTIVSAEAIAAAPPKTSEPKLTKNERTMFGILYDESLSGSLATDGTPTVRLNVRDVCSGFGPLIGGPNRTEHRTPNIVKNRTEPNPNRTPNRTGQGLGLWYERRHGTDFGNSSQRQGPVSKGTQTRRSWTAYWVEKSHK